MGVLTEYVRKEADQILAEMAKRKELLDEWLAAISKLYDQLETWIKEADGGIGLLGINRHTTEELISEPRLGHYNVNLMWVMLGGAIGRREAIITPKLRYTSAIIKPPGKEPHRADGMVEIKDGSSAEYYLFRLKDADSDHWYIQSVTQWNANPEYGKVEELDRDRFEAAILRILK
jgi:hypothetical protein